MTVEAPEPDGHRLSPPRGEVYVHGRRQPHSATCECGATFTTADSEEQLLALHEIHLAHVAHFDVEDVGPPVDRVVAQVKALGPMTRHHLLVIAETVPPDDFEELAAQLVATWGDDCPVIILTENGGDATLWDEDMMRSAGWVRADP